MSVRKNLEYNSKLEPDTVGAFADNSQSLIGGEALEMSVTTTGKVSEADALAVLIWGIAGSGVESGASAGFADRINVYPAVPANLFKITPDDLSQVAINLISTLVDLVIDAEGFHRVNLDASVTDVFELVDIIVTRTDGTFPISATDPQDVVRNVVVKVNLSSF